MLPCECLSFGSIVNEARYRHSFFTSMLFVFVALSPQTVNMFSKCAICFLHILIQPSLLIHLTFSEKNRTYLGQPCTKRGLYEQHIEAKIKHYTHTVQCAKTLWCLKLEWLFMQTEALAVQVTDWYCRQNCKTNPTVILNKTPLGCG